MRIGFDFDNTIVEYKDIFYLEASKRGFPKSNVIPMKNEIRNYYINRNQEDIFIELQAEVYGKAIQQASIAPGLEQLFIELRQNGHEIFVVSHKTIYPYKGPRYNLREAAIEWVNKQLIVGEDRPIPMRNVYFEPTKEKKIETINSLQIEIFVDDLVSILRMLPVNIVGILYSPFKYTSNWPRNQTIIDWKSNLSRKLFQ